MQISVALKHFAIFLSYDPAPQSPFPAGTILVSAGLCPFRGKLIITCLRTTSFHGLGDPECLYEL